jgi:hypothetical protein
MTWKRMREWRYSSTILDLGSRCRWAVSFLSWSALTLGKSPSYPLDMRMGGPQSRSGRYGGEKNLVPAWNRNPTVQPVAISTVLFELPNIYFLIGIVGGGVQLGPLGTTATNKTIVPAPGDYDDGKIGGIIGRGNRSTRRKPAPVPLCITDPTCTARMGTRAPAVGSQRLTAWATARPLITIKSINIVIDWRVRQNFGGSSCVVLQNCTNRILPFSIHHIFWKWASRSGHLSEGTATSTDWTGYN